MKNKLSEAMPEKKTAGWKCATCNLDPDVLSEVNDQRTKYGRSFADISIGLSRIGITLGESALSKHFRGGHAKS